MDTATTATLRAMGERGDIIRTLQRAMGNRPREYQVFDGNGPAAPVVGRLVAKGLEDELHDRGYLVVDGSDGRVHYVRLSGRSDLSRYPLNAQVQVRGVHSHLGKSRTDVIVRSAPVRSLDVGYGDQNP